MNEYPRFRLLFRQIRTGTIVLISGIILAISVNIFTGENVSFSVRLAWSRCLLILSGLLLLAISFQHRQSLTKNLREFWFEPGSPERLGVFRFVIMSLIVAEVFQARPYWYTELPEALRVAPPGIGWIMWTPLFNTQVVLIGVWLCGIFGIMAALGFRTNWTVPVTSVLAIWLMALPHFDGKVDHGHHLVWFAILLSASPCGDAVSVDRWLSRSGAPPDSMNYGWPIKCTWVLIGVAYFFPGFWKVWNCGFDWLVPEQMTHQLHAKWIELESFQPFLQIDQFPLLLSMSALFTICMELGFLPMIFFRRTRPIAAIAGFIFHLGTWLFMGIAFTSLQFCYVAFIPDQWFRKLRRNQCKQPLALDSIPMSGFRYSFFVGVVLVCVNFCYGCIHQLESWPFACYPTFDYFVSDTSPRLVLTSTSSDKQTRQIDTRRLFEPMNSAGELRLLIRVFVAARAQNPDKIQQDIVKQFLMFIRKSLPETTDDSFFELALYETRWSRGLIQSKLVQQISLTQLHRL